MKAVSKNVVDPVECRSDSEYAERPRALRWEDRRLEVVDILTRWRSPSGKGFRVRTEDDRVFELFLDEISGLWTVKNLTGG